jgi:hypothetical protein
MAKTRVKNSSLSENDAYLVELHDCVLAIMKAHPVTYEQQVQERFPKNFNIERLCQGYYSSGFQDPALRQAYYKAFGLAEPAPVIPRDWIDISFLSGRKKIDWPPKP